MYQASTRQDFIANIWKPELLPAVKAQYEQDGMRDIPARRETWNNYIDALVQDRQLPRHAVNWSCPD